MRKAFVILFHTGYGAEHYDLMFARTEALATWRLEKSPADEFFAGGRNELAARRIQDHRPAYLEYDGPVSGGRGEVKRIDAGRYELVSEEAALWKIRAEGKLLRGKFELARIGGDDWIIRRP